VYVNSYGTVKKGLTDYDLLKVIQNNFDLRPYSIINKLNLLRPIYSNTARYGHFGKLGNDYTWENPLELKY